MRKLIFSCIFLCILCSSNSFAQQPKAHAKTKYVDEQGRYFQHVSLPVYLFLSTSTEGEERVRLQTTTKNPHQAAFYLDGHGKHFIRHPMTKGKEAGSEIRFVIYADGMAPMSSIKFEHALAYYHPEKKIQFFGKGLTASLNATDEMSGVQQIYSSLDKSDYQEYQGTVRFEKEKEYLYQFYAVDRVGNAEKPQARRFIVDLTPPVSVPNLKIDLLGDIISPRTQIALSATDEGAGVKKIEYKIDDETSFRTYTSPFDLRTLSDNEHVITYRAVDNVGNVEQEKTLPIYLDKDPPIVNSEILGDRFVVGGRTYFSGRTKLKLQALDNKSGVQDIYYSIDGGKYEKYEDAFYLPTKTGNHFVNYYAIDKVGNKGSGRFERDVTAMYMDLTGPKLSFSFLGNTFTMRDTVYISDRTRISLSAFDAESGVQQISYNLQGQDDNNEIDYLGTPLTISKEGLHEIMFFGYDNVNNRNRQKFHFIVDKTGPQIFAHFSVKPTEQRILSAVSPNAPVAANSGIINVYPKHVAVFLAATDEKVGYDRIYYKLNNGMEQLYTVPITNFPAGKLNILTIRAIDKLGNESIEEMQFQTEK
jgi:hypothetical protein